VKQTITKAGLSPGQRRLLELMQEVNFGHIFGLTVCEGEPVFDPPLRVTRDIKIGGENGPRPEAHLNDFALKSKVEEFFEHLTRLGNGIVEKIEIKHGLPFRITLEEKIKT